MQRVPLLPLAILMLAAAAALPGRATEVYDTRSGQVPSWWRPQAEDAASAQAREAKAEAQRRQWLRAAPIGSQDFCATSVIVAQKKSPADDGGVVRCFMGQATEQELQANGWELTRARQSSHPHSPGFEVEVVNTVIVKRRCVEDGTGALRGPVNGKYGCEKGARDADLRPGLFWMPPDHG